MDDGNRGAELTEQIGEEITEKNIWRKKYQ